MRIQINVVCALTLICLPPATLSAQWLHYPTAGVPKWPDGKPNLNAPAPRTSGGRPDLSGIWIDTDAIPDPACAPQEDNCISQGDLPLRAGNIGFSSPEQLIASHSG